ncbi:unnamed protein product [Coffea canephora]|uniref:DH200=94 genomic scaffold, scaffold_1891 n=1 Tax=Coffea canephora TaxID=49390 RepID=A0A068VJV4_COFCA|nr:unnamed protein product [Coffea canephora]
MGAQEPDERTGLIFDVAKEFELSSRFVESTLSYIVLGTLLAALVLVLGFNAVMMSEHFASFLVFIIIHVVALVYYIKGILSPRMLKVAIMLVFSIGLVICCVVVAVLIALVASSPTKGWSGSIHDLHGIYLIIFKANDLLISNLSCLQSHACFLPLSDTSSFSILYIVASVYFSGVMVRLMLVVAPKICIMYGISLLGAFDVLTHLLKFQLPSTSEIFTSDVSFLH